MKPIWIVTINSTDNFEYPKATPYLNEELAREAYYSILNEIRNNKRLKITFGSEMNGMLGEINAVPHGWFIYKWSNQRTIVEIRRHEVKK